MRQVVRCYSAIGMLASGVGLSVAGFIAPPFGEISDSVLWFTAQCLIYAGSALGIDVIIDTKLANLKKGSHHRTATLFLKNKKNKKKLQTRENPSIQPFFGENKKIKHKKRKMKNKKNKKNFKHAKTPVSNRFLEKIKNKT